MDVRLPIEAHRREIMDLAKRHQVVIVAGETGSGKTTRVPRYLLEDGFGGRGMIGVTEPRRVAAVSVAMYVAKETGGEIGGLVGYQIRHERKVDPAVTRIKYMTEGVLLREFLADPDLAAYDAIVLDEVHERGVNQDLLMALVKGLLPRRPDLHVVVMSATMDEERIARYFDGAPIARIEGRMHPVEIEHEAHAPTDPSSAAAAKAVEMLGRTAGDVLVFVPDYRAIRDVMEHLAAAAPDGVDVLPLYGNQSPEEQLRVFTRERRSVIVATNVAETSVTLDGVTAVVDTGLIKEMRYFPSTAMSTLKIGRHSRAGCDQRAGRAGRTAPGVCARLYAREDYEARPAFTVPEIRRVSLEQVFLQLRAMGFEEGAIRRFGFIEPPAGGLWHDARETLALLGAIDEDGELTDDGRLMADVPLPPMVTRMVLTARRYRCVAPVITVAASFSTRPIFVRPPDDEARADEAHRRFRDPRSDFFTLLNAVRAWKKAPDRGQFAERNYLHQKALEEIEAVETQIAELLAEQGIEVTAGASPEDVGRSVAAGLAGNLLTLEGKRTYKSRKKDGIVIFPGSSLYDRDPPKHAVAAEIVETTRLYARGLQEVPSRWLEDILGKPTHRHRRRTKERFRRHRGRR